MVFFFAAAVAGTFAVLSVCFAMYFSSF